MSDPEYVILAGTVHSLADRVKARLKDGWQLHGSPYLTGQLVLDLPVRVEGEQHEQLVARTMDAMSCSRVAEFAQAMTKGICDDPLLAVGEQMVRMIG